jgi:hypothetical protein
MITGFLGAERFEIKVRLEGDQLIGRAGGALMGKDIALNLTDTGVTGTLGGRNGAKVDLKLEGGELVGTVGTDRVALRGVDQVTAEIGFGIGAVEMRAVQNGDAISGRIGGLTGKSFSLELDSAPGWMGGLLALVSYCALERTKSP